MNRAVENMLESWYVEYPFSVITAVTSMIAIETLTGYEV